MDAGPVRQLVLAQPYMVETCLMDLDDLEHNTRDGLHIASLAGTWRLTASAGAAPSAARAWR